MKQQSFSITQLIQKAENFCAYQERCHKEVKQKLFELGAYQEEIDLILSHLIENNFLNEERFAKSYTRGKHFIKKYGKIRITNELKMRGISTYIINKALEEISDELYEKTFFDLTEKTWQGIHESNKIKKKKKFFDTLLRKGYESDMIYQAWQTISKEK